jgi:glutamate dehydrogenase
VFSRSEKSIRLSQEMRAALGVTFDSAPPAELIRAVLRAKVDLLFFGGIGTFVKGIAEADEKVADRANDALRITAGEVGARVIGEGANLAMTQRARVEYGLNGGRCNSDAIDNSAGVNTSDVEVNIKIAFRHALADKRIDRRGRDRLLKAMTEEVAALVLTNNYRQTLAISLTERRGMEDFAFQRRLMRTLESEGRLDRALEGLPDEAALVDRQKAGKPLTRTEIGVLLASAKNTLSDDLLATDVPEDPALATELESYFPERMRRRFAEDVAGHRLRRDIIVTALANAMINRGGPTYLTRVGDQTGADTARIARAFAAVREIFGLEALNGAIDALDGKIAGAMQLQLYRAVQDLLLAETGWFARNVDFGAGIGAVVARFAPAADTAARTLTMVAPARLAAELKRQGDTFRGAGVPSGLADRVAGLPVIARAPDIALAAEAAGRDIGEAAAVYLAVAEDFWIARLTDLAGQIPVTDYYDELALNRAVETLALAQRRLAVAALKDRNGSLDAWLASRKTAAKRVLAEVAAMTEGGTMTVSAVGVAAGLIADMAAEPA